MAWSYRATEACGVAKADLDLLGTYTGRDGMTAFLAAFGAVVKVEAWDATKIAISDRESVWDRSF